MEAEDLRVRLTEQAAEIEIRLGIIERYPVENVIEYEVVEVVREEIRRHDGYYYVDRYGGGRSYEPARTESVQIPELRTRISERLTQKRREELRKEHRTYRESVNEHPAAGEYLDAREKSESDKFDRILYIERIKTMSPSILAECQKLLTETTNMRVCLAEQSAHIETTLRDGERETIEEKIEAEFSETRKRFKMGHTGRGGTGEGETNMAKDRSTTEGGACI